MISFDLYHQSGMLVRFNLDDDSSAQDKIRQTADAISLALAGGWHTREPEVILGPDKYYDIEGWALGFSKKERSTQLYLYSPISPEAKVTKPLYENEWGILPITLNIPGHKRPEGYQAGYPDKTEAKNLGIFQACPIFRVRAIDTGKDHAGEKKSYDVYKVVEVVSMSPGAEEVWRKINRSPEEAKAESDVVVKALRSEFASEIAALCPGDPNIIRWYIESWTGNKNNGGIKRSAIEKLSQDEIAKARAAISSHKSFLVQKYQESREAYAAQIAGN